MQPKSTTLIGVGLLTMAVLANEVILTRIFSVTLWYHFAFLVISLALLGSGAAGVWLYLTPNAHKRTPHILPWLALGYAVSTFLAFLIYQQIPITVSGLRDGVSGEETLWLFVMYAELTIPFIFAGATIALALRYHQAQAGRLYFADLFGASIGCLLSVVLLNEFGGAGSILAVTVLGIASAMMLSLNATRMTQAIMGSLLVVGLIGFGVQSQDEWLTLETAESFNDQEPIYEEWNAFSRITLYENTWEIPFGWGISQVFYEERTDEEISAGAEHLVVLIDEKAGTPIQRFEWNDGDENREAVEFLRYDLTALPYYLRDEAEVFVIGPGGGRDVLTAHVFDAERIVGVELNPIIVDLVVNQYPDYAGHIYSRPHVTIETEDARTFLAASDDRFDIIQASLIDTFAASSAGAFALSENGIYTVEAFENYYEHLTEDGIVNFSRWYFADGPAETLRLVSVGMAGWEASGVENIEDHLVVIANLTPDRIVDEGLAGMLLKRTPFTQGEIETLVAEAERLEFEVLYAPGITDADASPVAEFVLASNRDAFIENYPLDISPATDNRPFFFNVVRLGDLGRDEFTKSAIYGFGAEATRTLLITLGITFALSILLIILPLALGKGAVLRQSNGTGFIAYFAMLGLGFMLVQIPMVQKLNVYLGNPTYALALVLFSILLFSGIGSFMSQRVPAEKILQNIQMTIAALLGLIGAYILLLPLLLDATQGFALTGRAIVVVLMLMPAGLLMGRPFPLCLRYVDSIDANELMPWLWAANGTLSVLGSVIAVIVAIGAGFNVVFLMGVVAYGSALLLTRTFVPQERSVRRNQVVRGET